MAYNSSDTISAKEGRFFLDGEEVLNGIKLELDIEKENTYLTGVAILEDKSSGRGSEKISLFGINIDSATIINLDAEGDVIKDEIPFTIEDYSIQGSGLKDKL